MSNTNTEQQVQPKAPETVEKPAELKKPEEEMPKDVKQPEPTSEEQKLPTKEKVEAPAVEKQEANEPNQEEEEKMPAKEEAPEEVEVLKDVTAKKVPNVKESDRPTGEKPKQASSKKRPFLPEIEGLPQVGRNPLKQVKLG